jgi:hypothetical protein
LLLQIVLFPVGFEVLTPVVRKSTVFWDMSSSPLKVNRCFEGTYHLHLPESKNKVSKKQRESKWHAKMSQSLFLDSENGGGMFLRNVG